MVARVERPLATTVKEHIEDCIEHFAYDDALFLAELNHDQENSEEALLLLADCYYRTTRLDELFHLLKDNPLAHPRLRYIFASCCFELKKHDECVRALAGPSPNNLTRLHPSLAKSASAPFAYNLLSKLYCRESRAEEALDSAEKSVRLNCLHWSAVQEYLYLGGKQPDEIFAPVHKQFLPHYRDENDEFDVCDYGRDAAGGGSYEDVEDENNEEEEEEDEEAASGGRDAAITGHSSTPIMLAALTGGARGAGLPAAPKKGGRKSASETTVAASGGENRRTSLRSARLLRSDVENESASTMKRPSIPRTAKTTSRTRATEIDSKSPKRRAEPTKPLASRNSNNSMRSTSSSRTTRSVPKTRSTPVGSSAATGSRTAAGGGGGGGGYGARGTRDTTITPPGVSTTGSSSSPLSAAASEKDVERMAAIVQRMSALTLVHFHFVNFDLKRAEKEIALMHPNAQDTSQVSLARARILVEQGEYKSARSLLEAHHARHPHKVDGMEMLSTALWHEQDTHALSALATTLTGRARGRAESWCAAANSFSLAKQHSQAVQCLERAIKLNPRFVYSYTLLGCELMEMEELEKASKAFRSALCVRPRDYRAYYGLGMVHQKKEQLHLASIELGKAIDINSQNSVLYCAMSSILHSRGDVQAALMVIEKALGIDPHSVAAHYHKARYLYDMRNYPLCLDVLEKLKERASDEANVYFLLGKVYKRLGDTDKALLNFHWASSMDPRGESMLSDLGEHFEEEGSSTQQ